MPIDSSIPLQVRPPKFIDAAQLFSLQNLMQQARYRDLEGQKIQQELDQTKALHDVVGNPANYDPKTGELTPAGVRLADLAKFGSGQEVLAKQTREKMITQQLRASQSQQELALGQHDDRIIKQAVGMVEQQKQGKTPEQLDALLKQTVTQLRQKSLDAGEYSYLGDEAPKRVALLNSQIPSWQAARGGALGAQGIIAENKGESTAFSRLLDERDRALKAGDKKRVAELTEMINKEKAPTAGLLAREVTLKPKALMAEAETYRNTGKMSPLGNGSQANRTAIIELAQQLDEEEGIAPAQRAAKWVSFGADSSSLRQITPKYDAVTAFENMAVRNGEQLKKLATKIDTTGVPVIERWIRGGRKALGTDPDVDKFNAQITIYRDEVARVLVNPNLVGVLSDKARAEAETFLGGSMGARSILGVVDLLHSDFSNRKLELENQIGAIKQRLGGKAAAAPPGSPNSPATGTYSDPEKESGCREWKLQQK